MRAAQNTHSMVPSYWASEAGTPQIHGPCNPLLLGRHCPPCQLAIRRSPTRLFHPNFLHTFSKRFLHVLLKCSWRCRGDTDQRFPNVFDVGGFAKRTIKPTLFTICVTKFMLLERLWSDVFSTFFSCCCRCWCYVF